VLGRSSQLLTLHSCILDITSRTGAMERFRSCEQLDQLHWTVASEAGSELPHSQAEELLHCRGATNKNGPLNECSAEHAHEVLLVQKHKLGDESLQVVDPLVALLEPVLVVSSPVDRLLAELFIQARHEVANQSLKDR